MVNNFYDVIITFVKYELVRRFPKNCRYAIKVEGGEIKMANIKSAKKRIKVINTKTERNKAIKTKVKTYIKKVEAAIAANDKAAASEALTACISEISKATSKGIFHKNTASRKIARLSKAVNAIA